MELQREVNQRAGKNKEKKRVEGERGGSFARNQQLNPFAVFPPHICPISASSLKPERLEQARL